MSGKGTRAAAFFLLLPLYLLSRVEAESAVTCAYQSSCVLPCRFSSGHDAVITWTKREGETDGRVIVHDFYHNQNQLQLQDQDYRDRTSLFEDQISSGEASLLLKKVRFQDEGLYECFTSNGNLKKTFVQVKVADSVGVSLKRKGAELICKSENIYPRPTVTWTVSPELKDNPQTSITSSETGLFSVESIVSLSLSFPAKYSCMISNEYSWRSATYMWNSKIRFSDPLAISCTKTSDPVLRLVWRFNHKETICSRKSSKLVYGESWRPFVDGLTESNTLVLKDLTHNQQGVFTCELSTENEEFIIITEVSKQGSGSTTISESADQKIWVSLIVVLGLLLLIIMFVIVLAFCLCRRWKKSTQRKPTQTQGEHTNSTQKRPVQTLLTKIKRKKRKEREATKPADTNSEDSDSEPGNLRHGASFHESMTSGYECSDNMTGESDAV